MCPQEAGDEIFWFISLKSISFNEFAPYSYPAPDQEKEIKESVEKYLSNFATKSGLNPDEVHSVCEFALDPNESAVEFINSKKIDLAVVATQEKEGLTNLFHTVPLLSTWFAMDNAKF